MITKAVLLCGGLATRLLPITKSIPKEMLPIINRPAIDYCINDLKSNGITDILIIIGRNKECIESYYDRNIELESRLKEHNRLEELQLITDTYKDINLSFIRQIEAKGTGYATSLAKNFVASDSFVLLYPDELIFGESIVKQLTDAYNQTYTNILPLKKINITDCHKYGMVGTRQSASGLRITNFIEKPSIFNTPSDICYTGGGVFTSEIFDLLPNIPIHNNGEQLLTDIFPYLIEKQRLYGIEIIGDRLDIGSPLGYLKANILAGINDTNLKDELIQFLKSMNF